MIKNRERFTEHSNSNTATLFVDEDLFSQNQSVDATHIPESGNITLSTLISSMHGGLSQASAGRTTLTSQNSN